MPASLWRPKFDQRVFDKAQVYGDYLREHAERDLIPRIVQRQKQALNVVPDLFKFYQRVGTGRRCSCWSAVETSPSSQCTVCYGTGNTGGYELYGHTTEVFDVTSRWSSVNVVIDYSRITRPLHFRLSVAALSGYVEFFYPVIANTGACSLASLVASAPRGTSVTAAVKLFSEASFVAFSAEAVRTRLPQATIDGGMQLRVVLRRESLSAESPRLSHVRVRYRRLPDDNIRADVPRATEARRASEFAWFEEFATRSMYLDNTIRVITSDDFFEQINTHRRHKIIDVNSNAPGGILTSWDLTTRLVQEHERLAAVP
jgi:hypothetical protein